MTKPLKQPGIPAEDDYWLGINAAPAAPETRDPRLHIEDIPGVDPLDAQFGAWPLKTVPGALLEPLFGQPEAGPAGATDNGGAEEPALLKTYALIDAAKLHGGFDEIQDCGLPFRCLFQGEAAEELKDAAPYLIQLESDARFTRALFTHIPNAPARLSTLHLWHRNPGIFIRSSADFVAVWKHFRKFTRIRDENGKWFFFRFWEAMALLGYLQSNASDARALGRFMAVSGAPLSILWVERGGAKRVTASSAPAAEAAPPAIVFSNADRAAYASARWSRFQENLLLHLLQAYPRKAQEAGNELLLGWSDEGRSMGFRIEKANFNFVVARMHCGGREDGIRDLINKIPKWAMLSELDRSRELLKTLELTPEEPE
ncbi:DUF4123 domain-containing protein [Leisingera sp. ANG-M7]|uniref:DUF4123 domain-containing protein n=1 Tax=Leisingera sp. ANG-M7 TaxID=1577902 RepID=UPI00057CF911|nr:DUF4123 domain-containing protein [Leisingera sp. ANG-M7]KIC36985.1 hypothetical protein RA26_11830 [Leisingera sp. ANG-M7]